MTTDSADRALSQPSPETSSTGALTDIQLWELLPKRLEQNLLAMVQIAAPHHNLRPIDLLQNIAPDFVDYARAVLARWGRPAAPPSPEAPGEALAARPLLEQVAAMADRIGSPTVGEITAISARAAAWLRDNPPGQPVAIEPQGCPAPGDCSCVEPTPPAPEDLAIDQMMAANLSALLIKECGLHSPESSAHDLLQRAAAMLVNYGLPARSAIPPAPEPGEVGELVIRLRLISDGMNALNHEADSWVVTRAATLLQQQDAKLAALRGVPVAVEALTRLYWWGGMSGAYGYDADVVLGVRDWIDSGMVGGLPPLSAWVADHCPPLPAPQAGGGEE